MSEPKPTVLAVDDTPENIAILAGALGSHFTVRAATSGERALAICQTKPPDLVLLDVQMAELDGFAVCAALKADPRTAAIPVIFVTGASQPDDEERGFAAGAVDWVTKPFSAHVLRHRVQSQLDLRRASQKIDDLNKKMAAYLPRQLTESLHSGEMTTASHSRRRKLTVFFSDVVGFARQSEVLAPEELTRLLNSYFDAMSALVERHGGTLDKFIGDGLMVFFGDSGARSEADEAASCIAMALDMQEALEDLRIFWRGQGIVDPLRVRMGIATDYCNVGNFGSRLRQNYTALGRPVNLAARLQALAAPDTVLVSAATFALVGDRFAFSPTEPLQIKGIGDNILAYRVRSLRLAHRVKWVATGAEIHVAPDQLPPERKAELAVVLRELLARLEP